MNNNAAEHGSSVQSQFRVMPTANGHHMLLSAEEFPIYHLHITRFVTELRPTDQWESDLVQRIADNEWRIDRIARLEMGLYARGSLEFANLFPEQDAETRALLIQVQIHSAYAQQFSSLNLQEARLRRYVEKDMAALRQRQAERSERESEEVVLTAAAGSSSTLVSQSFDSSSSTKPNGFEFSNSVSRNPTQSSSRRAGYASRKVTRH